MAATPSFTKWDMLDPYQMALKLKTAHGSQVWDNFSLLSPNRAETKVNSLSSSSPKPFNNFRGQYDTTWTPHSLATKIGSI